MSIFQHSHDYVSIIVIVSSILLYFIVSNYYQYEDVFVDTAYGTVKGFTTTSRDGRTFSQFSSIPYAKPPEGSLRFQPPAKLEKWEGTHDASYFPYPCIQYDYLWKKIQGRENCLYLAVYTPTVLKQKEKPKELLPVMVYIHGGHFMWGAIDIYKGNYFMDEDIVLVTMQYRVGALGFLNTGDDVVPGNMGLKDQNAALKWVQENIAHFGGDRNRVLLFGESAGAASVHHHMLSEMSKGLFHRAIQHSGSSLCPWAYTRYPKKQAIRLGEQLNCPTGNSDEMVACLIDKNVNEIVALHSSQTDIFHEPEDIYGPSIEKTTDKNKETTFLSESPYKKAAEGKYANNVPLIIGVNSAEGCFRSAIIASDDDVLHKLSTEWNTAIVNTFLLFEQATPDVFKKIWTHYFGAYDGPDRKSLTASNYNELTSIYSNRYFMQCVRDAAILHANTTAPTFMYYLNRKNDVTVAHSLAGSNGKYPVILELTYLVTKIHFYRWMKWEVAEFGVCHADDIQYFFESLKLIYIGANSPHYQFSKSLIKLWTNFAKEISPLEVNGVKWQHIDIKKSNKPLQFLNLGENFNSMDDPLYAELEFWKKLKLPRNLEPNLEGKYEYL